MRYPQPAAGHVTMFYAAVSGHEDFVTMTIEFAQTNVQIHVVRPVRFDPESEPCRSRHFRIGPKRVAECELLILV